MYYARHKWYIFIYNNSLLHWASKRLHFVWHKATEVHHNTLILMWANEKMVLCLHVPRHVLSSKISYSGPFCEDTHVYICINGFRTCRMKTNRRNSSLIHDFSSLQSRESSLLVSTCEFLSDVVFQDFPAEVFLHRPNIIKVLYLLHPWF